MGVEVAFISESDMDLKILWSGSERSRHEWQVGGRGSVGQNEVHIGVGASVSVGVSSLGEREPRSRKAGGIEDPAGFRPPSRSCSQRKKVPIQAQEAVAITLP